jgi:hypothetical protein
VTVASSHAPAGNTTSKSFLGGLFLVAVFFPFINIFRIGTDLQPNALVVAMLVFFLGLVFKPWPLPIALLMLQFVFAVMLLATSGVEFEAMRSVANYASLFFVSAVSYAVLNRTGGLWLRILGRSVYIWFIAGFLQFFISFEYFAWFLSRKPDMEGLLAGGRGVLSLAPEPTFYGLVCLFFMLFIYFHCYKHGWTRKSRLLTALLLVQIVFMSRSTMVMVFIALYAGIWLAFNFSFARAVLLALAAGVLIWAINDVFTDVRFAIVARRLLDDPLTIYYVDESIHARTAHVLASMTGFFENYSFPHGYSSFSDYIGDLIMRFPELYWAATGGNRIMSGYGAAFFELGFVAFLSVISMTVALRRFFGADTRRFMVFALFINAILFSAIQLSFPLLAFLIGYLCYQADRRPAQRSPASVGARAGPALYPAPAAA